MKRLYACLLCCLTAVVSVFAQDIPTGLVRIKNRRSATAYLTAENPGHANAVAKKSSGLSQVWIIDTKGDGYIVRSANTAEYLNALWATPTAGSAKVYIQVSPNAKGYYNNVIKPKEQELRDTFVLYDSKGNVTAHCYPENDWFDVPTFCGSDENRPIYFVEK